jgi:hypothetical protein
VRKVEGVVTGQLEGPRLHEVRRRSGVVGQQADQSPLPLLQAGRASLFAGDLGLRDVDEPDDIAVRRRVRTEEGGLAEHKVPGFGLKLGRDRGALGDATEVGQADVPANGGLRIDCPTDQRVDAIGADQQVAGVAGPVLQRGDHPSTDVIESVPAVRHGGNGGAAVHGDAPPFGLLGQLGGQSGPFHRQGRQPVLERSAQTDLAELSTSGAVHDVRLRRKADGPRQVEQIQDPERIETVGRQCEVRARRGLRCAAPLEDHRLDADPSQCERRGRTSDAASHNQGLHFLLPSLTRII